MAHIFEFSVLRLMPDLARGEAINIGLVVFKDGELDVRVRPGLNRARLLYPELTESRLNEGVDILRRMGAVKATAGERHRVLANIGLFALGELGYFTVADDQAQTYQTHIDRLLKLFVDPPKAAATNPAPSRSRLASAVRKVFRQERVLATVGDAAAIHEHKIVPAWPLPNSTTLKADLALQNGMMRVCEIVDLSGDSEGALPSTFFTSVVTLEAARTHANAQERVFAYQSIGQTPRIDEALKIADMNATRFVDWNAPSQRDGFLHDWICAAKSPRSPVAGWD